MRKQLLAAVVALSATLLSAPGLRAQEATPPPSRVSSNCSSGLSGGGPDCPLDRRLLIDLRRHGAGAPRQLNEVVHLGAWAAEVFNLSPEQATAADSTLYAILDVNRDASGQYRVQESIGGSLVTHPGNCRGAATGKLDDLTFGAYLATITTRLAQCAQHARSQTGTTAVVTPGKDTSIVAHFRDTAGVSVLSAEGQTFKVRTPSQRQALRATLRKERELWQARKPRDYRFLLRVGCFCPGNRGWLLIEIRSGQPLRAWDRTGKSVALTDWNTFSIDGLYDSLERGADKNVDVQIAFDPRWHFPTYVRTVILPGPDAWSIIDVRGFRPM